MTKSIARAGVMLVFAIGAVFSMPRGAQATVRECDDKGTCATLCKEGEVVTHPDEETTKTCTTALFPAEDENGNEDVTTTKACLNCDNEGTKHCVTVKTYGKKCQTNCIIERNGQITIDTDTPEVACTSIAYLTTNTVCDANRPCE